MSEPLLRIQFDETLLFGRFNGVDSKLNQHEEMIKEIQNLLKKLPTSDDITNIINKYDSKIKEFDDKNKEFDNQIKELNNSISGIQKKIDSMDKDINDLKSNLDDRFSQLTDFFNIKLRQQYEELSGLIPHDDFKIKEYDERIKKCEADVKKNKSDISNTASSVLEIADSIASLTNSNAKLDSTLPQTMNNSMYFIKSNFEQVYNELNSLKEQMMNSNSLAESSRNASASPRPQIFSPRVSTPVSPVTPLQPIIKNEEISKPVLPVKEQDDQSKFNIMEKQKNQLNQQPMILNINKSIGKPSVIRHETTAKPPYDLSIIRPYPSMTANWRDKPELPPICQFVKLEDAIDYIYRVQPPLQAYLNSMHKKIYDDSTKLDDKIDKDAVHKMFQRVQSVIGELKDHIDGLKKNIENTATRDEINDIFEELMAETRNIESQTAIGRVRCIACGREMHQVTGAMTEDELARALGTPPNSIVRRSGVTNSGVSYSHSSKGKMDSEIIESPRSVRPFKPKRIKAMIKPV